MNIKLLGLVLISAGFLVGCGEKDLNKDFKPVGKDAPMPSAVGAGAGSPNQATPAASPP